MLWHRSGEGYQNISIALKVPKNTVASIILKWKKFGTTKTLPRAGCPAKLSNRGRRALVKEVTKNPMVTLTKLQFLCGDGRTFHKHSTNQAFKVEWPDGSHSSVKDRTLGVCQKAPKDSQTMRNKILWSDETLWPECQASRLEETCTIPVAKHVGGSIMRWECFSVAGTGRLARIDGKMNGDEYRDILDENLLRSAQDLRIG